MREVLGAWKKLGKIFEARGLYLSPCYGRESDFNSLAGAQVEKKVGNREASVSGYPRYPLSVRFAATSPHFVRGEDSSEPGRQNTLSTGRPSAIEPV